jgi:hypothetical protein
MAFVEKTEWYALTSSIMCTQYPGQRQVRDELQLCRPSLYMNRTPGTGLSPTPLGIMSIHLHEERKGKSTDRFG